MHFWDIGWIARAGVFRGLLLIDICIRNRRRNEGGVELEIPTLKNDASSQPRTFLRNRSGLWSDTLQSIVLRLSGLAMRARTVSVGKTAVP